MSLFENSDYEWRETYIVLFHQDHVPQANRLRQLLEEDGGRVEVSNLHVDDNGVFESLTVVSPGDFAAMDIICTVGEEVAEQFPALVEELAPNCETDEERAQLTQISKCSARIDIFHFEQTKQGMLVSDDAEMEFMDPGGLLMVLERIADACQGIVVDPQTSSIM